LKPEDIEDLYARRLSDKVEASVDAAIKRRYAWIGIIAIVVSWIGGWAVVRSMVQSSVDAEVKSAVDAEVRVAVDRHVKDYEAMRSNIVKSEVDTSAGLEALEKRRSALEQLLAKTEELANRVQQEIGELTKREDGLEASINQSSLTINQNNQRVQQQIDQLAKATDNIVGLARQVTQLQDSVAALAKVNKVTVAADTTALGDIIASVQQYTKSVTFTGATVYLQYAGGPSALSAAQQIADQLRSANLRVPGVEAVSPKVNEVRFYYKEDTDLARQVADDATKAKTALAIGGAPIKPISYINWPKVKPPMNTVELWMDLSQAPP
jgi:hypothetical protein